MQDVIKGWIVADADSLKSGPEYDLRNITTDDCCCERPIIPGSLSSQPVSDPNESQPCAIASSIRAPPLVLRLLRTTQQTSPAGGDETSLLTLGGVAVDCRGLTNMLMVTTSVRLWNISTSPMSHGLSVEHTWSTGFIATPRVLGHELRLAMNLCLAREASVETQSVIVQDKSPSYYERTQQGLVCSPTSGNDPDHSSDSAFDDLLRATW